MSCETASSNWRKSTSVNVGNACKIHGRPTSSIGKSAGQEMREIHSFSESLSKTRRSDTDPDLG